MIKKILLSFPQGVAGKPMAMELIKTYNLDFNILKASIDDNIKGTLLLEIMGEEADINAGIIFLRQNRIGVQDILSGVDVDEEECVDCGACTAVCTVNALEMDENWKLVHHKDKCLECMLCVKACPTRAIHALI
ncbi:NIL domain-containing protein [Acetobacterium sp.]|uniref:NIL domain-containing protein n=1 Tax=Acetobacterium sp. TaxID=1872094 RepID=UPI002F42058C